MKIFETFECSGEILSNSLCQFWNSNSIPLQILYPFSVSWRITPLYFFSLNNIYFAHKEPIKVKIFETFEHSGQNLTNSWCQFLNEKLISLQILYPSSVSWKITLLYLFSSNNIYFAQEEHIKMKIFETFKCLGQNVSNSSCQFWNEKSIPLQILHHSSLPWHFSVDFKLTLFLLWIKGSHQYANLRLSIALVKICHIPHVIFQTASQFFFKFCITLQCHER